MSNNVYNHMTDDDLRNAEDIREIMIDLDPIAQRMILERVKGMKDMQDILTQKTA